MQSFSSRKTKAVKRHIVYVKNISGDKKVMEVMFCAFYFVYLSKTSMPLKHGLEDVFQMG